MSASKTRIYPIISKLLLSFILLFSISYASDPCLQKELLYFPAGEQAISLHQMYQTNLQTAIDDLKAVIAPTFGDITGRPKLAHSILAKLTQKQQRLGVERLTLNEAQALIGDGLGTRLTLELPVNENKIALLVQDIIKGIQTRKIVLTEIHNYRGPNVSPYFSDEQVAAIARAAEDANGSPILFTIGDDAIRESGYTGININLSHHTQDGAIAGEFQIRGDLVGQLASVEHFLYDVRRLKPIAPNIDTPQLRAVAEIVQNLSKREKIVFETYIQQLYRHARDMERFPPGSTVHLSPPRFPRQLRHHPELQMDRIKRLINEAKLH